MTTKPLAIALCGDLTGRDPQPVAIHARRNGGFMFYAPGYRKLAFHTLDGARAKLARHPGFVQWVQA